MHRVAVYGSLKHGQPNHDLLSSATLVKTCWILGWKMYDLGAYPAIIKSDDRVNDKVWCEIYDVHTDREFESLDRLEGYPQLYNREKVNVGSVDKAWVYFMEESSWLRHQVPTGNWLPEPVDNAFYHSRQYNNY